MYCCRYDDALRVVGAAVAVVIVDVKSRFRALGSTKVEEKICNKQFINAN